MDARRLDHKALTELRKAAVKTVEEGESPESVARTLQISRAAMYAWLARYRRAGWAALDARKRGGRPHKLDGKALKWIYDTVTMKNPLQLKFPSALWTAKMVGQAINDRFGIRLSKASVCRLLARLGLSPQRPVRRAYQQRPEDVRKWLNEEYPRIRAIARHTKAQMFFADDGQVRSDQHTGTTRAINGEAPVAGGTGTRFGFNIINAITPQGEFRFMAVRGRIRASHFVEFMQRLLHGETRMVFLIVGGHPVYKARIVRTFVKNHKDRLRLFYLPFVSPELNPDERV
ncbi:MAG: IS630 family transposase [Syntrophales bacterium LBB04]|nr:IS630 family transposase [Syntrophales bacterium LBB04]